MTKISEKTYKYFSEQLAQRFELKVKGRKILSPLPDTLSGVKLVPLSSAEEVKKIELSVIEDNTIYFYAKSKKQGVYHLLRHFRNCASHKDRITKKQKNGNSFYQFEDKNKSYVSMRGNVCIDKWDVFIEKLYADALDNSKEADKKTN